MAYKSWKVHKFGGTSLSDAACFQRVISIVSSRAGDNLAVVVSAMGGMTDQLLSIAASSGPALASALGKVRERYETAARELVDAGTADELMGQWHADAATIDSLLAPQSPDQRSASLCDSVAGFGEIWSARLLAAALSQALGGKPDCTWLDARKFITIRESDMGPAVVWDKSHAGWKQSTAKDFSGIAVVTGFIACDEHGAQTTLGRNGSDHSAAIIAALCDAVELTIWTDVDGVMSADPNKVPDAQIIDSISYSEAMELAYFGAKVIHPQTLGPAVRHGIPVNIRNTFNAEHAGSRISAGADVSQQIKGITAINNVALINLEGAGMIGVPGTADRLFSALKDAGVSVTLISQASSEHSICVAVPQALADQARKVIRQAFTDELLNGQIQRVEVTDNQSIVAVVGDGMAGSPGLAARFFGNLAHAQINVRAIAQGSSERNISAVVNQDEVTRALRAAHSGFYLSDKTVSVGVIGPGTVGGTFLDQVRDQESRLSSAFNLDLRVRAIARSRSMAFGDRRIDLENWRQRVQDSELVLDFEAFEAQVHPDHIPHAVIIDCSASDDTAERYAGWLERGIHIVTPNKRAFSGPLDRLQRIRAAAHKSGTHVFYETTVGAALPVIKTLRDLLDTGDQVQSVEGIFSGTLAYLFNVYDGTTPFSEIVASAKENGFTEPDPRDDLSGTDVARKLTILAREMGQDIELGDFPVQSLVPEALADVSVEEYLARLADYDDEMQKLFDDASANGRVLRYIAKLDHQGKASVGLEQLPADSSFGNLELTDNIVQFRSMRYAANPLIIQGPGAGPEVTAGGVFGDLLTLANYLSDGASI